MFVDAILLHVFLDPILLDEIDVFCWSIELFIVDLLFLYFHLIPIVSFCSYLCQRLKKCIWFKNLLILKVIATQKNFQKPKKPQKFSFFVFYFNVSNKISSSPPRLLSFQEYICIDTQEYICHQAILYIDFYYVMSDKCNMII